MPRIEEEAVTYAQWQSTTRDRSARASRLGVYREKAAVLWLSPSTVLQTVGGSALLLRASRCHGTVNKAYIRLRR